MIDDSEVLCSWSARKLQPIVLLYVAGVFLGFIVFAHFVVGSPAAVKALALTSIGAIVPLVPAVLMREEFRLSPTVLEKRKVRRGATEEYDVVVHLAELDHLHPISTGFKFHKTCDETSPFKRFWKIHISDAFSGEVHVEAVDRERVFGVLADLGVSIR